LTALGPVSAFRSTSIDTSAWANGIPFGQSPPQEYGDSESVKNTPPEVSPPFNDGTHGGFSGASPSTSPRAAYRLPVRHSNSYQSFRNNLGSSPGSGRPTSMPVQQAMVPPLPHHPQSHFYGVHETDLGLNLPRSNVRKIGTTGLYAFGSLATSGYDSTLPSEDILLVAIEHGLIVYAVAKEKLDVLGRLDGLRGEVVGAKILSSHPRDDPLQSSRPLVAVIIHGIAHSTDEGPPSAVVSNTPEISTENQHEPGAMPKSPYFQTTVEIYSLKDRVHITTLFRTPVIIPESRYAGPFVEAPSPMGNLSLHAKGRFLTLTSGASGEVYIFEVAPKPMSTAPWNFKCIGKTWTSNHSRKGRSFSSSSSSSELDGSQEGSPSPKMKTDNPIVSLSNRWLVIAPPPSSSRSTLQGKVTQDAMQHNPPGLKSHSPPSQPQISCELDTPEVESLLNKVARDVTQEVIKGARWVGDQGIQAFRNYWNRPPESNNPMDFAVQPAVMQQAHQLFPPTHANDDRSRASNQPALVSILDLEKLSASQDVKGELGLHPLATFTLPGGCSFVSLSPSGLSLLTASEKGDVQYVWDLMRMVHNRTSADHTPESTSGRAKPTVRQIARFTRMTVANIMDVVWTEPKGERLAIVTDRGTVHIFDMPPNAFLWPPPRQLTRPVSAPGRHGIAAEVSSTASGAFSAAVNMVSGTASMVSGTASPLIASIRGRPPNIKNAIAGLDGITARTAAEAGSKVVAAGLSKSMGAASGTVKTIRHLGENRLQIPGAPHSRVQSCVWWLTSRDGDSLAVVGNGMVRIYNVRQSNLVTAGRRRPSVVGARPSDIKIPAIASQASSVPNALAARSGLTNSLAGFWYGPTADVSQTKRLQQAPHPLSFAEIETSAPYQPIHTNAQFNLNVYTDDPVKFLHLEDDEPWVFGENIPSTQITYGAAFNTTEDGLLAEGEEAGGIETVISMGNDAEGRQKAIVTTQKRKDKRGDSEEEEGMPEELLEWVDVGFDEV
jgi:hypothetical protein